jgi:hypothetical protein
LPNVGKKNALSNEIVVVIRDVAFDGGLFAAVVIIVTNRDDEVDRQLFVPRLHHLGYHALKMVLAVAQVADHHEPDQLGIRLDAFAAGGQVARDRLLVDAAGWIR